VAGGKFTIKSRAWNIITAVGVVALLLLGFGGLFYLQSKVKPSGTTTLIFLVVLGVITFLFFAGPGLLYPGRKRVGWIKKITPGGTMAWVRAHMYLPFLALLAAFVHGTAAPFRASLSTGKVLLALSVLVLISGYFRHHMIGLQKEALNVNVEITKLTSGQSRHFRELVGDFLDNRRPMAEIEAEMASMDRAQQVLWVEVKRLAERVHTNFPREGGQSTKVIHYKMWKALHPPLTIALFIVLAFHIWDVFGGTHRVTHTASENFATAQSCAGCHSDIYQDWTTSAMTHAQTGLVMKAQLPVTLQENKLLAQKKGAAQTALLNTNAKVCINCHAPAGASLVKDPTAVLPFNDPNSASVGGTGKAISNGNSATLADGIGCIVCHSQATPPAELAGAGQMDIGAPYKPSDYGTLNGPLLKDPNPLPVRVHTLEQGATIPNVIAGQGNTTLWSDTIQESQTCGACHDVKIDMNGNGTSAVPNAKSGFIDASSTADADKNFILDQNELQTNPDGTLQDLVLQTTYDEWQDYVIGYKNRFGAAQTNPTHGPAPLGCVQCHMPTRTTGDQALVDYAPGLLPLPKRTYQAHTFVGVDYDLDTSTYKNVNGKANELPQVLADRQALLQSAVSMQVNNKGAVKPGIFEADVKVSNNFLGHAFPTGFAFARQFWLEVSAVDTTGGKNTPVCLADAGPTLKKGPGCGSGENIKPDQPLPQCDLSSVAAALTAPGGNVLTLKGANGALDQTVDVNTFFVKDKGVVFSKGGSSAIGDCDPWLANFQKILTDGGATAPGVFNEVAYQSLLPDIVKLRTRIATDQVMAPLESVRLRPGVDDPTSTVLPYAFNVTGVPAADLPNIKVTAKMHLRHLPPEFLDSLAQTQKDLGITIPKEARLDAPAAKANLVIDDGKGNPVAQASSGDGIKLLCQGPQNDPSKTISTCADQLLPGAGSGEAAGAPGKSSPSTVPASFHPEHDAVLERWPEILMVLLSFMGASALLRRRVLRRRSPG
jgi:hypothetical protein